MQCLGLVSERADPILIASSMPVLELMDDVSSHSSEAPKSWLTERRLGRSRASGEGGREHQFRENMYMYIQLTSHDVAYMYIHLTSHDVAYM